MHGVTQFYGNITENRMKIEHQVNQTWSGSAQLSTGRTVRLRREARQGQDQITLMVGATKLKFSPAEAREFASALQQGLEAAE